MREGLNKSGAGPPNRDAGLEETCGLLTAASASARRYSFSLELDSGATAAAGGLSSPAVSSDRMRLNSA